MLPLFINRLSKRLGEQLPGNAAHKIMMIKLPYISHKYYKNPVMDNHEDIYCIRLELYNTIDLAS